VEKLFMNGNEAIAEAAIRAGCRYYFGYPITPQNEIPEYMCRKLPELGGAFLQAESEIAAIYMVFGAAGAGVRVMTSSSSPGISLKQEGLSYLAAAELPCVIVNMMRAGPGLGGIHPSQGDYFQACKGGGHGDYHLFVLAPSTVQEATSLTIDAFDIADKYRSPVLILGDGIIGQMMEPVAFDEKPPVDLPPKDWALGGAKGRGRNTVRSLFLDPVMLEKHNQKLQAKYESMKQDIRFEHYMTDDAEIVIAAYGTVARIAKTSVQMLREKGIKVGLLRPITLFPFPTQAFADIAGRVKKIVTIEMSHGQMVEDVRLAVNARCEVCFYGRSGGMIPSHEEIVAEIEKLV
jgi:2-oxoglutarate/2-oxoacid ferredoxin oxidoreductase subunit alpha